MGTDEQKQDLRKRMLERRNKISEENRMIKSRQIIRRLCELEDYQRTDILLLYYSFRSEVITDFWIEDLLKEQKKEIYLPRVCGMELDFYPVLSKEELKSGYQKIMEPLAKEIKFSHETVRQKQCLLIVPGVAFDRYGNRMGYGKGFYDRFLTSYPMLPNCAFAFECQMEDNLPSGQYDRKVQKIITEKKIYDRTGSEIRDGKDEMKSWN